jgi:formamidopyrimidine-DNA glycosylase
VPELPEVETVRAGLARFVLNRTIQTVAVDHPRAVRRHMPGAGDFSGRLIGRRILSAQRRGKYLWLPLDSGEALLAHLGMSGQMLVQPPQAPPETHLRVRLGFADDGPELRFVDQRTFGGLSVESMTEVDGEELPLPVAHIALDPLDPRFDPDRFVAALRRKRTELKRALLDQSLISGIGNIYADEALWAARLHYARPTEGLSPAKVREVLAAATDVMTAALAVGGTSFDSLYVNVNGAGGYFDRSLHAYGREGKDCDRCGTPIRREPFMNRSSYFCPKCQRKPRSATFPA